MPSTVLGLSTGIHLIPFKHWLKNKKGQMIANIKEIKTKPVH